MLHVKNILIPVGNEIDSYTAIKKAMELCEGNTAVTIHLLYLNQRSRLQVLLNKIGLHQINQIEWNKISLENKFIKNELQRQLKDATVILHTITHYNLSVALIQYINKHQIELMLYCKKEQISLAQSIHSININKIAKYSSCAIMAVKPNCLQHNIKTILIPVSSFIPERRIQTAIEFARKYNGVIHLVALLDHQDTATSKKRIDIFFDTYRRIKECGFTTFYKVLNKGESHQAVLQYAQQINADLILLNPEKQSWFYRFMHQTVIDLLQPFSGIHILIMKPNVMLQ